MTASTLTEHPPAPEEAHSPEGLAGGRVQARRLAGTFSKVVVPRLMQVQWGDQVRRHVEGQGETLGLTGRGHDLRCHAPGDDRKAITIFINKEIERLNLLKHSTSPQVNVNSKAGTLRTPTGEPRSPWVSGPTLEAISTCSRSRCA